MKYKSIFDYTPALRRLCKRCNKMYMPTGRYQKLCENCKLPNGKYKIIKGKVKKINQEI